MPVEPLPSPWVFPDLTDAGFDDLVAAGADLQAGTLLAAYRRGIFPMPGQDFADQMLWWSPTERAVLPLEGLRVTRSMRRSAHRFEVRVDTRFTEVVEGCADPSREGGWIDAEIAAGYLRLHELGWAHSVECWRDGRLVGGLYGVAVGGLFAGESMFHRETDASKVALMGLVDLLRDEYAERRLIDVQWQTPHLASLGAVTMSRAEYLARLADTLAVPLPAVWSGDAT